MSASPNLRLPFLDPNQNQKTVTHNAALTVLDALVNLHVAATTLQAPPASPNDGQCWIVASGATGAWTGKDLNVAAWQDGAWSFYAPNPGFIAYVDALQASVFWNGSAWVSLLGTLSQIALAEIGVGTAVDASNPLSAKLNAALFAAVPTTASPAGTGDVRVKLSKQAAGNTASLLFQDNTAGRAEIGLAGDDNFHVKVSPDGLTFSDAMVVAAAGGAVSFLLTPTAPTVASGDSSTRLATTAFVAASVGSGGGATGATGATGPQGGTGAAGPQGTVGAKGATGSAGPQGVAGATAATGPQGVAGAAGATGAASTIPGPTGATGPQGATGAQGPAGSASTKGDTGATGPTGATGLQGATGAAGAASTVAGPTGATGSQGAAGPTGAAGAQGATGPADLKPLAAWATGTAYVVVPPVSYVSIGGSSYSCLVAHTSGTFATDLAAGKWGIVASVGAAGATGATGAQGTAGTTGAQGGPGATGAQGTTGTTGAQGAAGATGAAGPQGSTGATGLQGATGTAGATGPTGPQGATGATGLSGFGRTQVSDAAYTILASDRSVAMTALSAARTLTLPAASAYPAGAMLTVLDESGACSATVSLTLAAAGSDRINGAASAVIASAYGYLALESNTSNKWTIVDAPAPVLLVAGRAGAVTLAVGDVSGAAPLASPAFTGIPTAPNAAAGDISTALATTSFVAASFVTYAYAAATYATLASPTLTGTPTSPTAAAANNSGQIASTAYADRAAALGILNRTQVADVAYTVLATDRLLAVTALTAAHTLTLPAASAYPQGARLTVVDESGACSATNAVTLARNSTSDTIDGAASAVLNQAYAYLEIESNGANKWTIVNRLTIAVGNVTGAAALASPALTGTPTAPTAPAGTNTTQIATTSFVAASFVTFASAAATYATLASPTLTGTPTAPTPAASDNSTKLATTAYVTAAVGGLVNRTQVADANYTIVPADNIVAMTTLTAARTLTLPGAASYPQGQRLTIIDESGACSAANSLTTVVSGSDTIGGAASLLIASAYGFAVLESNGSNKWTVIGSTAPVQSVAGRTGAVTLAVGDVSGAAPLASPALSGTPTAPNAAAGTNTAQLATTSFVAASFVTFTYAAATYATSASPTLTGTPTAPTPAAKDNSTKIATTAYADRAATATIARTQVSDAAYTVLASDRTVAVIALTAARTFTLPAASAYPQGVALLVMDESGGCSTTNAITIARASTSDAVNGGASVAIAAAYGFCALQSNGANKWTVVGH